MPRWLAHVLFIVVPVVVGFAVAPAIYDNQLLLFNFILFVTLAQGVNVIYGFTGYLPFGYVGFFGAGAYGFSLLVMHLHAPPLVALVGAGAAAIALGLLLTPLLRLSGAYFSIANLAAALAVLHFISNPNLEAITRGPYGVSLKGIFEPKVAYGVAISVMAGALLVVVWLRNSRVGLALQAVREDAVSAAAAGIDVARARAYAWLISAVIAGLAGGVFAWYVSVFYPETVFGSDYSIFAIVFALFGGVSTIIGPIVGVLILYGVYNFIGFSTPQYFQLIYGALIMGLVLFLPQGLISLVRRRGIDVPDALLRADALVKTFYGFRALDQLSLHVSRGEILGLVGPNGSGKTTCINVVSGLYAPESGSVKFDGAEISGLAPHKLVHLGVARTFQVPKPFMQLTARENVEVAIAYGRNPSGAVDAGELLASLNLGEVAARPAAELTSAQQKTLDLARALATGPKLLLVDELAAGLNPAELDWVAGKLKELAQGGMSIIVVEHLMGFIEQVTDRVVVMNAGREIFGGTLGEAVQDKQVIEVFLEAAMRADAPLLITRGVEARYGRMQVLWGVDIDVAPGETILLLGANGAGKTTFLKTIVGLQPASAGRIAFAGDEIQALRADKRMRRGIAYMSELGVFPDLTIEENIRIGAQALSSSGASAKAEEMYGLFPVLREKRAALASSLSGGQRKMLGIAKALAANPRLLVMDEPSAGLSPLFVGEVMRTLGALRGRGLALLIAEQNIGFLDIASRVYVLEGGRIRFSGTVADMEGDEALRKAYFGLK